MTLAVGLGRLGRSPRCEYVRACGKLHDRLKREFLNGERLTRVTAVVTVDVEKISVVVVST